MSTKLRKSCKNCTGTGFVRALKNKEYCKTCTENNRCYLCENTPRLGIYDYCNLCDGQGYHLLK